MSRRLNEKLAALRADGRAGLVPFFSIGDPDLETSRDAVLAACEAGADVIEIGVPFSDPIADGVVVQESSQRALAAGSSLPRVLEIVAWLRARTDVPMVLFGYYNPFLHYGEETFARDAAAAGADAVLCIDLPPEEAAGMVAACRRNGLANIFLLAPTSNDERMRAVAEVASGFIYMVSVTGVTGARSSAPAGIETLVAKAREATGLPIGVGFGISSAAQAADVARYAELVVVGSALVRRMFDAGRSGAVGAAREFVAELRAGIDAVSRN
ncbi:MAG TPA: tryptophan synthase subunit alpha [Candidatus Limnocylindrales bacterium]|nr:tryptophan synthase subunit alpha [Candidatus Limnocylindrales bacterium]